MWTYNSIAAIDIWSSKIRTTIGYFNEEDKNSFHVLGVWVSASNAIRKGNILDMEEFKDNLDKSLEEAEKMAGEQISGAYLSFNSSSFEVITSKGIIAVSGEEILPEDVDRSLDMAKSGIDLPNREILKIIPEYFVVDLEQWVKNPVGMAARKLEVVANIFSMNINILNNIRKAVTDVGIEIYDIYPNLLSSPEGVLTKRKKELGSVCIDIGASTTGITLYEDGVLRYSSVIPVWGDSVTNDIALGLRTSTAVAEKLKLDYAELDLENADNYIDKKIDLAKLGVWEEWDLSLLYLSQIATARYEEIFWFIRDELKMIWKDGMLPEWAVCVWGGSKMKWFLQVAKSTLKLPAFIGIPISKDELADTSINDPVFASVIGTMILSNKYWGVQKWFSINIWSYFTSITDLFKKLLP